MQKSNKILLRVVAALLCLVLISSTLVSGIFARFAIKKKVELNVELERLGVTVSLTVDQALYDAVGGVDSENVELKSEGGQISVTIKNLKMAPGDDFTDMIHFNFSGEANTRCKVVIDFGIDYNFDDLVVWGVGGAPEKETDEDDNLLNEDDKLAFFPFKFTCNNSPSNATITSTESLCGRFDDVEKTMVFQRLTNNLLDDAGNKLTGKSATDGDEAEKTDLRLEKIFEKNAEIYFHRKGEAADAKTKDLYFGFEWPFETSSTTYNYNAIETWLVTNYPDSTISFTYTVSVEQITDSYAIPDIEEV